jgi:peptidoglycan/xylan/chitin deacetylase (PgdA/CDA1 family)
MIARAALERAFAPVERTVTALLREPYAWLEQRAPRLAVLMYHQVGHPVAGAPATSECVPPERLDAQVAALKRAGFACVTLAEGARLLRHGPRSALRRTVVLTFDDGFAGQFDAGLPILRAHAVPATFFVVAGHVGAATPLPHLGLERAAAAADAWRPFGWAEVAELRRHGMEIGSHALSHRSLGVLPYAEAVAEVHTSRVILETRLRANVQSFAYPFGSLAYGDVDDRVRTAVGAAGYKAACTTVVGRNGFGADPLMLRRIPIDGDDDPGRVVAKALGAYDWVGAVKGAWQRSVPREEQVGAPAAAAASAPPGVTSWSS